MDPYSRPGDDYLGNYLRIIGISNTTMGPLALVTTILVLYILGLLASLFGPAEGRFLGVIAFLGMVFLCLWLSDENRKSDVFFKSGGLSGRWPVIRHGRGSLRVAIVFCLVVSLAAMVVELIASRTAGVADGSKPVFAHRDKYQLNYHGTDTTVSRTRFLVVGSSYLIAWHFFGIFFSLFGLHLVLFGEVPEKIGNRGKVPAKKEPPTDWADL